MNIGIPASRAAQLEQLARMFGAAPARRHQNGPEFVRAIGQLSESPNRLMWTPPTMSELSAPISGAATVAEVTVSHFLIERRRWARTPHTIAQLREQVETLAPRVGVYRIVLPTGPAQWTMDDLREFAARMRDLLEGEPSPGDTIRTSRLEDELHVKAAGSLWRACARFTADAAGCLRAFESAPFTFDRRWTTFERIDAALAAPDEEPAAPADGGSMLSGIAAEARLIELWRRCVDVPNVQDSVLWMLEKIAGNSGGHDDEDDQAFA